MKNSTTASNVVLPDKLQFEKTLWHSGLTRVAGVDEAGRGPLAGPVVAAAVVFAPGETIAGVDDSKKLTAEMREKLYPLLLSGCLDFGVGVVSADDIDRINIYQASLLAMKKALAQLHTQPEHVLIDGRARLDIDLPQTAIIKGDALSFTIGAASIIAKVVRDLIMRYYHRQFPGYGFNEHKGYSTNHHLEALRRLGPCAIHRRSFRPRALQDEEFENRGRRDAVAKSF
ncbi:MAG: ribonuclease HII [bacterium]